MLTCRLSTKEGGAALSRVGMGAQSGTLGTRAAKSATLSRSTPNSRGDGKLYAASPWRRMAGLMSAWRGTPSKMVVDGKLGADLGSAIAELDAAIAAADHLIATIAAAGHRR